MPSDITSIEEVEAGTLIADHFVDVCGYSDVALFSALADPDTEVDMDGL